MAKILSVIFGFFLGGLLTSIYFDYAFYTWIFSGIWRHKEVSVGLFSAIVAAIIAIWGIFSQRSISRRVFTLSCLSDKEIDKDLIAAKSAFIRSVHEDPSLEKLAGEDQDGTPEAGSARTVLNNFELISIGIQKGVIDYDTYKLWFRTGTIDYWNKAEPLVTKLRRRESNEMLYHEFESLVKWLRGSKKPKRGYIIGHWFW